MSTLNKEGTFDRRGFVKGSMAAAAIMGMGTLAACSPTAKDESGVGRDPLSETGWDDSADVVVVGLGGGLGAVLSAAEAGVTVIGIEKLSMLGGNWAINSGIVFAPATDAMKAAGDKDERTGQEDTIESAVADWIRCSRGNGDPVLVEAILKEEQAFINSLVAAGVDVRTELCGMADAPIARGHYILDADGNRCSGGAFVNEVTKRIDQTDAKIMTDTEATALIFDDNYSVCGVEVKTAEGRKRIGAKAVVVATGGYTASQHMRAMYNPETVGWGVIGHETATGDGYRMLLDQGAAFCPFKKIVPSVTMEPNSGDTFQSNDYQTFWKNQAHSLIMLDDQGRRNRPETMPYTQIGGDLLTSPNYQLFDQAEVDDPNFTLMKTGTKESLAKAIEDGWILKADTVEELAEALYLDPDTVAGEVADYNAGVAAGKDKFGRPVDSIRELKPPFYMATGINGMSGTDCNCVKVDEQGRELDGMGNPLKGVYGGGNDMFYMNWAGPSYIASGGGAGACYAFSAIVGRNAAAYAQA